MFYDIIRVLPPLYGTSYKNHVFHFNVLYILYTAGTCFYPELYPDWIRPRPIFNAKSCKITKCVVLRVGGNMHSCFYEVFFSYLLCYFLFRLLPTITTTHFANNISRTGETCPPVEWPDFWLSFTIIACCTARSVVDEAGLCFDDKCCVTSLDIYDLWIRRVLQKNLSALRIRAWS